MKLFELIAYLESVAPLQLQESYDNSGLIYGDLDADVKGVLCALDCTKAILEEAKERNCNVVVSHHPIIFSGIKKINTNHYVDQALIYAIQNHIAIYAIHTNLDNVLHNGVNQKIALKLGLQKIQILNPKNDNEMTGAGLIGQLPSPLLPDDFLSMVKTVMKAAVIRHTRIVKDSISTIGIAGGSGAYLIKTAILAGCDALVTADIKYHDFFDADDRILLLDIGHYESEHYTIELLYELISQKFSTFATHYTKNITNPVHYF